MGFERYSWDLKWVKSLKHKSMDLAGCFLFCSLKTSQVERIMYSISQDTHLFLTFASAFLVGILNSKRPSLQLLIILFSMISSTSWSACLYTVSISAWTARFQLALLLQGGLFLFLIFMKHSWQDLWYLVSQENGLKPRILHR